MNVRHTPAAIYRANRAAGYTAQNSLAAARYITATLQAVQGMTEELIFDGDLQARYTLEDTNAGVTVTYEIFRDLDTRPDDSECYDAADVAAWAADDWHYYGFTVTATMGRFSAEESLWGIDAGDYWETPARPLDAEGQVMSTALEHYPVRAMIQAVQDVAIAACLK